MRCLFVTFMFPYLPLPFSLIFLLFQMPWYTNANSNQPIFLFCLFYRLLAQSAQFPNIKLELLFKKNMKAEHKNAHVFSCAFTPLLWDTSTPWGRWNVVLCRTRNPTPNIRFAQNTQRLLFLRSRQTNIDTNTLRTSFPDVPWSRTDRKKKSKTLAREEPQHDEIFVLFPRSSALAGVPFRHG